MSESTKNFSCIVSNAYSNMYGEILYIELDDGGTLTPCEDTGGENAAFYISEYELQVGDKMTFDMPLDEYEGLCGIESVDINGIKYRTSVDSEGGNTCTYLQFDKQQKQ